MLFLLEGGKRLLAGGNYVHDLFESNPPLIYYFSMGINWLANTFSLSNVLLFKLIIYIFIIYSLTICHYLLHINSVNFNPGDSLQFSGTVNGEKSFLWLLLTLAFCLLILSAYCFGEREHLMLILAMPYYFLLYQSASDRQFTPTLRITISVLAALGFAIKPYFLFSLVFCELLLMYWRRSWKTLFRLEAQVILAIFVAYLISIAVLLPDFYSIILPWVLKFYVPEHNNIIDLLTNHALVNAVLLILGSLLLSQCIGRMELLLIVIILGFMSSFIVQGKGWFYHAYPLITMNSLLATLLAYNLVLNKDKNKWYPAFLTAIIVSQFYLTLLPYFVDFYNRLFYYKNTSSSFQQLTNIARKYAQNQYIFFFSTDLSRTLPVVYYSDSKLGSRFPTLWMLPGLLNKQYALQQCDNECLIAEQQLRHYIIEDFKRYRPQLVYVDINTHKNSLKSSFDYLNFMQKSSEFKPLWQHYCYLLTSSNYAIYQRCQ
ncbi:hypothetical protein [Legionella fallonii]|nr:hypothetical protein [Legionella fallonii]